MAEEPPQLSEEEKKTALRIARYTLTSWVCHRVRPGIGDIEKRFPLTETLRTKHGVFVTLELGRGVPPSSKELRGCIGYVSAHMPLFQGICENAVNAASEDPRFGAVAKSELARIAIEISAMTPMVRCRPEDVVVGRDGIEIERGSDCGLLLPQVATERGWNREEFLGHTCRKAGIEPDAWKDKRTVVKRFSAQVFGEDDFPDLYNEKW